MQYGIAFTPLVPSLVLWIALAGIGARRWRRATGELWIRVEATRESMHPAQPDGSDFAMLPPPVQQYLRTVLRERRSLIATVNLSHRGTLNLSASAQQWKPFVSNQRVVLDRPAFVWDARVALFPGATVRVHDAYVAGEGILHASLGGFYSIARQRGGAELARGELMRFLAEAAWYPTRLLPAAA